MVVRFLLSLIGDNMNSNDAFREKSDGKIAASFY